MQLKHCEEKHKVLSRIEMFVWKSLKSISLLACGYNILFCPAILIINLFIFLEVNKSFGL